jgi:hypothetical protein
MDELKLTGNCLRGSRPLLQFDAVGLFLFSLAPKGGDGPILTLAMHAGL